MPWRQLSTSFFLFACLSATNLIARPMHGCLLEEKLDDYLQHVDCYDSPQPRMLRTLSYVEEEARYNALLEDITGFLAEKDVDGKMLADAEPPPLNDGGVDNANRLVWESASMLSNSRPPSSFVIYSKDGDVEMVADAPPLFDGSVANATPPPLGTFGGGGASGGYGTLLHLACAIDSPLALSMLLVLGADARASHTAFRRLMIHEAACCGSIQCLTLLLELGQECSTILSDNQKKMAPFRFASSPRYQTAQSVFPRGDESHSMQRTFSQSGKEDSEKGPFRFTSILRTIRDMIQQVREGKVSEMDASRSLAALARLPEVSRISLARSCSFSPNSSYGHFILSQGWADGHGNTPLHWAAFKNVASCVSLLLHYSADANARAQPSGWTPLHDAAYSNSHDSVKLLLEAGADVDLRANSGATPLCFAAQEDAAEAVKLLLDAGADLTARCAGSRNDLVAAGPHAGENHHPGRFSGYTPLHYCAHYNAHHAARVLLAHRAARAAMEIPDLSERLPIHVAVARASSDVLKELLHAGARVETALTAPPSPQPRQPAARRAAAAPPPPPPREMPPSPQLAAAAAPRAGAAVQPASPVSSPVLRSLIPSRPVNSSKPWNCLSQRSIDECRELISLAEQNWAPARHALFTPADRAAVMELLRVGKRLEQQGTGIFTDLWPQVLSFCGRGWFEVPGDDVEIVPVHVEFGGLPELRLDQDYY